MRLGLLVAGLLWLGSCATLERAGRWASDRTADFVEDASVSTGVAWTSHYLGAWYGVASTWLWKWVIEPVTGALFGTQRSREPTPSETPGGAGGDSTMTIFGFNTNELLLIAGVAVFLWAGGAGWLRRRLRKRVEESDREKERRLEKLQAQVESQEREIQRLWDAVNRK